MRVQSQLYDNVVNNVPIPLELTHDPTSCRIDRIKIIDTVGGIISNKPSTRNKDNSSKTEENCKPTPLI